MLAALDAEQAIASTLKDGTYTGSGMSRHGGVNVSVTVQNGRIVAAPITSVTTRYSQSVIAGLPARVVAAQSGTINLVSGATDSSAAYQQAVAQALSKAQGSTAVSTSATSPTGSQATTTGPSGAPGGSVRVTGPNGTIYSNSVGGQPGNGA